MVEPIPPTRDVEYDAVADVRALRLRDIALTQAKWARVEIARSGADGADVERRLLVALGLDRDAQERQ